MTISPKISIVVPIHSSMKHGDYFLWRLIQSVMTQTYKNYEIVITQEGSMPMNTNAAMKKATGDLVKILYLDDYFAHPQALEEIVHHFGAKDQWLATGCLHQRYIDDGYEDPHSPHYPEYTQDVWTGNNLIGSPSVMTFRREGMLFFDENLSWLLDADLYHRYFKRYGPPTILKDLNVILGVGDHQMTHILSDQQKATELTYLMKKVGSTREIYQIGNAYA